MRIPMLMHAGRLVPFRAKLPGRHPWIMDEDDEPLRCALEMGADGDITVTLFDGCGLAEAVDLCQIVLGRGEVTSQIVVRQSRSA
jgi:hypothetical protein